MGFLTRFFTNWRASLAGLATLVAVGYKISQHGFDAMSDLPAILSGLGLIGAKGNNVTGGVKHQDGGTIPAMPPATGSSLGSMGTGG
jgi:hypothetical protein